MLSWRTPLGPAIEKLGPIEMASLRVWLMLPELAWIEIAPLVAFEVADTVIVCATPGTRVTVEGVTVSPVDEVKVA